jgi:hypothetical protein
MLQNGAYPLQQNGCHCSKTDVLVRPDNQKAPTGAPQEPRQRLDSVLAEW